MHMRKQGGGLSAAKIEKGPGNVTIRRGKKVTIKVCTHLSAQVIEGYGYGFG